MTPKFTIADAIGKIDPGMTEPTSSVIETARRGMACVIPDHEFTNTQLLNIARPVAIDWSETELKYPVVKAGSMLRSYAHRSGLGDVARQTILVCQPNMVVSIITPARFDLEAAMKVCFGSNPFYNVAWMRYVDGDLVLSQGGGSRICINAGRVPVEVCPPY